MKGKANGEAGNSGRSAMMSVIRAVSALCLLTLTEGGLSHSKLG